MPGLDHLCRQLEGDLPILLTAKQVSSVARQLGRPRVLVEAFACIRHSSTLEDYRWLADANLALGANFFCPHMQVYSMRGRRKRDYPPNIGEAQTYWTDFNNLNDYLARLCYALTRGHAEPDLLVLHPIQNAMADHRLAFEREAPHTLVPSDRPGLETQAIQHWDALFRRVVEAILNAGFDCDLGDEGMLADFGSVEGSYLRVGEMKYSVVVVPPSRTWTTATTALLEKFVSAGGKLLFIGEQPTEIDCEPAAPVWTKIANRSAGSIACSPPALQVALDRLIPDTIRVRLSDGRPATSLVVHKRREGNQRVIFVANLNRTCGQSLEVILPKTYTGAVSRWDALTGKSIQLEGICCGDMWRIPLCLRQADSALLVIDTDRPVKRSAPISPSFEERVVPLSGPWNYRRSEPNVLVIDRLSAEVDNKAKCFPEDMDHRIRLQVARHFQLEAALDWQPWMAKASGKFDGKGGSVVLHYRFDVKIIPASASLVMEWHQGMCVAFNGTLIDFQDSTMRWERNFRSIPIESKIQEGENHIEVSFPYHFLSEIEPLYIVGDFGVRLIGQKTEITSESPVLHCGSWVEQALPFYSGEITYKMSFERPPEAGTVHLRLRDPRGTLFRFRINDSDTGKIFWSPYELDLTNFVIPGINRLE
ncbi:MAG: hypothetical protein ACOYM3_28950, partial [Terrimicrobiaceae bacterium]